MVLARLFETRMIKTTPNCSQHRRGRWEWRRIFFGLADVNRQAGHCRVFWERMEMMVKVKKTTPAVPPIIRPRTLPCTCMA